jgi:cyclopropane fatty-acyl-phospholipid synthase-like methyltransferase
MTRDIYHSGEYVEKNPTYHVEDSPWKAEQILKMMRKHSLQVRSVCEIGCGAGEILRQLQLQLPADIEFYGYEISPQAAELWAPRANERLHFYCGDLLATETAIFDLLLCIDVFEHVDNYMGFLRSLRPKADLKIFHIPLDMSVQWVLRRRPILKIREEVGHLHSFMKDTALATLHDTGYEILDWFYTADGLTNTLSIKAKLAKFPRQVLSAISPDATARILGGYSLLVLAR